MGISDGGEYQIEYFEKCFTIAEFALDESIVFGGEVGRKRQRVWYATSYGPKMRN